MKIQLILDCCGIPLTLLQCIPGTFTCPSIGCGTKYTYSWCCGRYIADTRLLWDPSDTTTVYTVNIHMSQYWLWYQIHILLVFYSVYREHSHVPVLAVVPNTHTPGVVVGI